MKTKTHYIGVDLGKQSSYFVIKDETGKRLHSSKVFNDRVAIEAALKPYLHYRLQGVMEATCNYYWLQQELSRLGCEVILAHPRKTRAIADAKVKNDRLDANILCDLLRANLIPQSYIPSEEIRLLRELVRQHIRLVQMRTQIKNQIHSLLTKLNCQCKVSDLFGKQGRLWLSTLPLPEVFAFQRKQALCQLDQYDLLIKQADRQIQHALKRFPQAERLRAIPGIGLLASAMLIAEIGPIERFPSPKKLASYAGIAPGLYESGKTSHQRGITHEGNSYLRWILCQVTQVHIRKPGPLRQFFLRLKERIGYTKALIATSRKLLIGIYFVLKGENFAPTIAG